MNSNFAKMAVRLLILSATFLFSLSASAYSLQDDPSSTWGGDGTTTTSVNGNVYTIQNLYAENLTNNTLPALNFVVPFIWPRIDDLGGSTYEPMQWSNNLNGWHTDNFNQTGLSLTVQLSGPASSPIAMSEIADLTGTAQLPLTEPCSSGSPSCIPASYPTETVNLTDLVPLISLGEFAPNEKKYFDLSFTYAFGDQSDALPTAFIGYTVSPIPLPATFWLFGSGVLALTGISRRKHVSWYCQ